MGEPIDIAINPGGFVSDVEDHKLGFANKKIAVSNLRQKEKGKWEITGSYAKYGTDLTSDNYKAIFEVVYDKTSERFILAQGDADDEIYRYDYDTGDSDYIVAKSTIALPSGVTIPAGNILEFHFHNNVVRIL